MMAFFSSVFVCFFFACPWLTFGAIYMYQKGLFKKLADMNKTAEPEKKSETRKARFIQERIHDLFDEIPPPPIPSPVTSRSSSSQGSRDDDRFVLAARLSMAGSNAFSIQGRHIHDVPGRDRIHYAIGAVPDSNQVAGRGNVIIASRVMRPKGYTPEWSVYDHENDSLHQKQPLGPLLMRQEEALYREEKRTRTPAHLRLPVPESSSSDWPGEYGLHNLSRDSLHNTWPGELRLHTLSNKRLQIHNAEINEGHPTKWSQPYQSPRLGFSAPRLAPSDSDSEFDQDQ